MKWCSLWVWPEPWIPHTRWECEKAASRANPLDRQPLWTVIRMWWCCGLWWRLPWGDEMLKLQIFSPSMHQCRLRLGRSACLDSWTISKCLVLCVGTCALGFVHIYTLLLFQQLLYTQIRNILYVSLSCYMSIYMSLFNSCLPDFCVVCLTLEHKHVLWHKMSIWTTRRPLLAIRSIYTDIFCWCSKVLACKLCWLGCYWNCFWANFFLDNQGFASAFKWTMATSGTKHEGAAR